MNSAELVFLRTPAGRIHKAAIVDDRARMTDEACNLDDVAGDPEVLTQLPVDVAEEALCRRCFPPPAHELGGEA